MVPSTLALLALSTATALAYNEYATTNSTTTTAPYSLVADYSGADFFSHFDAFTGPDPTNGFVNYTDISTAASLGLVGFAVHSNGSANSSSYGGFQGSKYNSSQPQPRAPTSQTPPHIYIGVDATSSNVPAPGRNSVRLSSKSTFSAGMLAVMDIHHMPTGYGTWPAAWFLGTGQTWPAVGEIDVIENTHMGDFNAMTLHTAPGCTVDNATAIGRLQNGDCNSGNAAMGCSTQAPASSKTYSKQVASAGEAFNKQGGAIYVTEWTAEGVRIWAFDRASVPSSLNTYHPSTSGFPTPLASFSGSGCDFEGRFKDMTLIINTAFCGDWAGKTWVSSGAAQKTGVSSCEAYVAANPEAFGEAYWEIGGVKIYANTAQPGVKGPRPVPADGSAKMVRSDGGINREAVWGGLERKVREQRWQA